MMFLKVSRFSLTKNNFYETSPKPKCHVNMFFNFHLTIFKVLSLIFKKQNWVKTGDCIKIIHFNFCKGYVIHQISLEIQNNNTLCQAAPKMFKNPFKIQNQISEIHSKNLHAPFNGNLHRTRSHGDIDVLQGTPEGFLGLHERGRRLDDSLEEDDLLKKGSSESDE